jgi:hypothetical protein
VIERDEIGEMALSLGVFRAGEIGRGMMKTAITKARCALPIAVTILFGLQFLNAVGKISLIVGKASPSLSMGSSPEQRNKETKSVRALKCGYLASRD